MIQNQCNGGAAVLLVCFFGVPFVVVGIFGDVFHSIYSLFLDQQQKTSRGRMCL